ncbi:MAG: 5'-3' exonuclease H3TH domain-containing protein, partial [Deferribacterota bacterium]|nr:5'-3' exonuclease H3TH domain-containing protein [Deferribacterota bacterium]
MIVIIDGHSIAYRAFYKTPPLMTSSGFPTGVIHTFINTLLKIKNKLKPEQIIVSFDSKGETERHRKLKEYKAEREATPDDLIPQIEKLKKILPLMGIPVYALEGFEADDIIYTIINKFDTKEIVLVTKDKDIYQLVSDRIKIYDDIRDHIIDSKGVLEKFGVESNQIPDFLALTGDASDNIPGVKGIGSVTAKKLLREFNSLDDIYANIDKIKGSVKEKLLAGKEIAYLSKSLTELKIIENLKLIETKEQREELKKELEALELHTLYNRL